MDEEDVLETVGRGIEGQVMAVLLNNPQILNVVSKMVGAQLTDDEITRLHDGGSGVVDAGKRYRSAKKHCRRKERKMSKMQEKFMSIKEDYTLFGLNRRSVERRMAEGKLVKAKVGNRSLIAIEEVE